MKLTDEQTGAVAFFQNGNNVKVEAVPGAGKSRVIIEACKVNNRGVSIVLSYNRDLCEQTMAKLKEANVSERVLCYTFHGLCCACICQAYNDQQLHDAVDAAEKGIIQVERLTVASIFIDEAQDFKNIFHRLLKSTLNVNADTQYMVVGDSLQMLYDYDDEDPADLKYLSNPEEFFVSCRPWSVVNLTASHRITPQMAAIVSTMFGTHITSATSRSCPIVVRTMNMWKTGPLVREIVSNHNLNDIVVLTERKHSNGPLRCVLNYLSMNGIKIYIQGIDGQDDRIKQNKLCISSWHASKGTEKRVVVIFGIRGDSGRNSSFVAMTRSYEHLYVINDENCMHPGLLKAVQYTEAIVNADKRTKVSCDSSITLETPNVFKSSIRCLDNWQPTGSGRWLQAHLTSAIVGKEEETTAKNVDEVITLPSGHHEFVSTIYCIAIRLKLEWTHTNQMKHVCDILAPERMSYQHKLDALRAGNDRRIVPQNIPDFALLPYDLKGMLQNALHHKKSYKDWVTIATAVRSWNDFHHTMRQLFPFNWVNESVLEYGFQVANNCFGEKNIAFDTVLRHVYDDDTMAFARCHACDNETLWHFTFSDATTNCDRNEASVRAAIDCRRPVRLVNLKTGVIENIVVSDAKLMLSRIKQQH